MRSARFCFAALAVLSGCQKTEECKALSKLKQERQRFLQVVKVRAKTAAKTEKNLKLAKSRAQETVDKFGFGLSVQELEALLKERASVFEGASLETSERVRPSKPSEQTPETESLFVLQFGAASLSEAWGKAQKFLQAPPLLRLVRLSDLGGHRWKLETTMIEIKLPVMKVEPTPFGGPKPASEVPKRFGFCGARRMRKEIEGLEQAAKALVKEAEKISVHLPLTASWNGYGARAANAAEVEVEARRLSGLLLDAAIGTSADFRALGAQGEAIVLELRGDEKLRKEILSQLPQDMLETLRQVSEEMSEPDLIRIVVGNKRAAKAARPQQGMRRGHHRHRHGTKP